MGVRNLQLANISSKNAKWYITISICRLYSYAATRAVLAYGTRVCVQFVQLFANKSLIGAGIAKFLALIYSINIKILHTVQALTQYKNIISQTKQTIRI
jgi:hypothetical protein